MVVVVAVVAVVVAVVAVVLVVASTSLPFRSLSLSTLMTIILRRYSFVLK